MTKLYQNFINADRVELMRRITIRQAKSLYSFLEEVFYLPGQDSFNRAITFNDL